MHPRLTVIDVTVSKETPRLCDAVFSGLSQTPKTLPCRFFYDDAGSELFERITDLDEYYLTRSEAQILERYSDEIVGSFQGDLAIVEFGSGSSAKTRLIIEAALRRQSNLCYTPIDISHDFLVKSSCALLDEYQDLEITAVAAEYLDSIAHVPSDCGPRLILFLGSNIGNFTLPEAVSFLSKVAEGMSEGDRILLGADLVKDHRVLQDAYNDSEGVTAEFNLNLLRRINRDLKANFDVDAFEHFAPFDPGNARVEMRLVCTKPHTVYVEDLESSFTFEAGEVVITEFSHKYTVESVADIAAQAGLSVERRWTDDQGFFCEFLLRKPPAANRELGQAKRKEELAARLEAVRSRTLDLLANVSDDFLRRRVHDFYSPIGWHFGHVGRTEEYWICKATGAEPSDPQLSFIYSDLADNPKDNRINIPDREGTILYLKQTREFALRALEAADLSSSDPYLHDGYAWEFAIQHECQHHETIAEMLHLIQWKLPQEPVEVREWRSELKTRMIRHEGGVFTMGDANIHGYDNEKDPHLVHVEPFELAEYPVTCYQWSEFISDGGYENRRHWTEAGWEWLKSNHVKSPFYWKFEEGGYSQFGPFGLRALNPDEPVMGISHHEAVAYANWKGLRLPTETEWEYAASQSGSQVKRKFPWGDETPDRERACHGMNSWGPCQAGTSGEGATPLGVQEMAGNVWEWTASKFLPYPGFEAFPYDGYSKDHMLGGHFVCRGGSWATSPIICRNTFRNWYVPTYRQGFLGVRLANS